MKHKFLFACLLLAPALAACSDSDIGGSGHFNGGFGVNFDNAGLVINASGKPSAHINANGDLRIGDALVTVTPAQRELLKGYYGEAMAVRDDGIATGKAGAALGLHAVGSVFGNLLSGTPDKIDQDMDTRSKSVDASAQHLCGDIMQLKTIQQNLAAQLPTFRPYQVFRGYVHCDVPSPPPRPTPPEPPTPPTPPTLSGG
ncbi:MAG: hypothetical protein ABIY40_01600 [Rhodanobacteraceae bacterium]